MRITEVLLIVVLMIVDDVVGDGVTDELGLIPSIFWPVRLKASTFRSSIS